MANVLQGLAIHGGSANNSDKAIESWLKAAKLR